MAFENVNIALELTLGLADRYVECRKKKYFLKQSTVQVVIINGPGECCCASQLGILLQGIPRPPGESFAQTLLN